MEGRGSPLQFRWKESSMIKTPFLILDLELKKILMNHPNAQVVTTWPEATRIYPVSGLWGPKETTSGL